MSGADTSLDGGLARLAAFRCRTGSGVVAQLVEHHNGIPLCAGYKDELSPFGLSVSKPERIASQTLADAIADLLRAKEAARRRPAYIRSLRQYLALFSRGREQLLISSVSVSDLDTWFTSRGEAPATQASNVGRLSALFEFGVRRGWLLQNPCRRLERITVEPKPPRILTPAEAARLMEFATISEPDALGWFSLCLFAGVRPNEADQIHWGSIRDGTVTIDAAASKVRRRRIVHLMPAASAWLAFAQMVKARLPVPYGTRRRAVRRVRDAIGLDTWPQDILRHTAASYWLASVQDAGKVAHELGNSAGILLRHYRELVTKEDAARFWAIRPSGEHPTSASGDLRSTEPAHVKEG